MLLKLLNDAFDLYRRRKGIPLHLIPAVFLLLAVDSFGAQQSSVTLSTPANPVMYGQLLTLTATVSPSAATGKVTLYDSTTIVGIGRLSNGQATITTSLLRSGTRSLQAYYPGSVTYVASASPVLKQVVTPTPANRLRAIVKHLGQQRCIWPKCRRGFQWRWQG